MKSIPNKYNRDQLKSFYGTDYVESFAENKLQKERIKNICKHLSFSSQDVVADVGCGIGLLFDGCKNFVKEYHGVDFSESFINNFKKRIENDSLKNKAHLHCDDVVTFSKKNAGKFTKITTLDFSEHIYDDQFLEIYAALKIALKKDGNLYIHTPNKLFFMELLKDWGILKQIKEHIGVRTAKEHLTLLHQVGFTSFEVKYISHYGLLKRLHFLSFIPFIGKYFQARILIEAS